MATALHGKDGSVKVGGTAVALVDSWDLTLEVADFDITSVGDQWQTLQAGGGSRKVSGSVKVKHSRDDTNGQSVMLTNAIGGTGVTLSLYETGTASFWSGTAMLHPAISVPATDKQTATFSFTSSGPWTHTG